MKEEKFYFDTEAGEVINLRDCKAMWIHKDYEASDDYKARHTLRFAYYGKSEDMYLHYETSKLLKKAFTHYVQQLNCIELDVSSKPVTL